MEESSRGMGVRKKRFGRCRICEKFTQMTKEHVPPKRAFNDRAYLQYYIDQTREAELRQWRTKEVNSSGISVFSLCQRCNNKTGKDYGQAYIDFVSSFVDVARPENADTEIEVKVKNLFPARVVKQAVSMILSTSTPGGFGGYEAVWNPFLRTDRLPRDMKVFGELPDPGRLRDVYEELRTFVRRRDVKGLPPSVRLYCYATVNPGSGIRTGILANATISTQKIHWGVMVGLWPVHWLLTLEGEPDLELLDVTEWSKEDYKTRRTLTVSMPFRWTFAKYPLDFRPPEKYRRDGFVARMGYEGYIPLAGADDEQRFAGAVAFARQRGTLTTDGIFSRQFETGTYAEYKGEQLWFESRRRNEVLEYLRNRSSLGNRQSENVNQDDLESVP